MNLTTSQIVFMVQNTYPWHAASGHGDANLAGASSPTPNSNGILRERASASATPAGRRRHQEDGGKMNLLGFQNGVRVFIVWIGIRGLVWLLGRAKNSNWAETF